MIKNPVQTILAGLITLLLLLGAGCTRETPTHWQGYIEGEFVYVSAPLGGQLDKLAVKRGDQVEAGAPLFQLENSAEIAAQQEAASRLAAAQAKLGDLQKGQRPSEIATLEARLQQARTAAELSRIELQRQEQLHESGVNSVESYDRARLTHEKNLNAVAELNAQLETARLGGRTGAIEAAQAEVAAAQAALARADWSVAQKTQTAPQAGLVYDTLYRAGEYVAAARPIVALLPPANVKVRFFVPEKTFSTLQPGQTVDVVIDGQPQPLAAQITYLSLKPEYTPPVLYNRENRSKLVFMIEAVFSSADAAALHPGQPVDVGPAN